MTRELFDAAFLELLHAVVRRTRRIRARGDAGVRARRRIRAASGTFAGHRRYVAGDDPRAVDWNAFARSNELHVKVLEDDDRRTLSVLLDAGPRMAVGEPSRFDGARRVIAVLGALALARLDGLRVVWGARREQSVELAAGIGAGGGGGALRGLLDVLERLEPDVRCTPDELAAVPLDRGFSGSVVWVSDFARPDAVRSALRGLRSGARRCSGLLPQIPDDRLPAVDGWLRVVDADSGHEDRVLVDAALRRALGHELVRLRRRQDAVFAASGCPLLRFPVPAPDDDRLASWSFGSWLDRL